MATTQGQDSKEVLNEKEMTEKTQIEKNEAKKNFETSENFSYLTENLEPTTEAKTIVDIITSNYENLEISKSNFENTKEKLSKKYDFSENISKEELAIIETVENKIGNNLKPKEKLELIRLLSGIEIKEKKKENKLDKSNYSKELIDHPDISKIEGLYLKGAITEKEFIKFIKSNSFEKALNDNKNIKNIFEKSEKNNNLINFEKEYSSYIPDEIKESFIIKKLEEEFIGPIELNEPNAKEYNLFVSIEKTLNKTLEKHKYFYKPDNYYDAIDYIRKVPEKSETINDFFSKKLNALAYVIQLATGENPWRIDEKNMEAGEQQKAIEQKEEKNNEIKEVSKKNTNYEKIIQLYEKNNSLGLKKQEDIKEHLNYIKFLENQDKGNAVNNPNYNPGNPSEILSEKHEAA